MFKLAPFALFSLALAAPATVKRSQTGSMSFYAPGLGACGNTNSDSELIAAVSASLFDSEDVCGKSITITGDAGTTTVTVVDRCPGCGPDDLDLSSTAFQAAIGDLSIGRKDAEWDWA